MASLLSLSFQFPLAAGIVPVATALAADPPAEVWVDDDFTSGTPGWGVTAFKNINQPTGSTTPSTTNALAAVAAGGTIHVAAGTYQYPVTIAKSVTLLGANSATPATGATRGAGESRLVGGPTPQYGDNWGGTVAVDASDVTVSGFEFVNRGYGIAVPQTAARSGLTFTNNWLHSDRNIAQIVLGLNVSNYSGWAKSLTGVTIAGNWIDVTGFAAGQQTSSRAIGLSGGWPMTNLAVTDNHLANSQDLGWSLFAGGVAANYLVSGFTFARNTVAGGAMNIGDITDGTVADNTFGAVATNSYAGALLGIDNTDRPEAGIRGNTFTNAGAVVSRLTLWGTTTQTGAAFRFPSDDLVVANNDFPAGSGIRLGTGIAASTITLAENAFVTPEVVDCATGAGALVLGPAPDSGTGILAAERNYWGTGGPGLGLDCFARIDASPWIVDYTPDPVKAGATGFWPTATSEMPAPIAVTEVPVTVEIAQPALGDPSLGISAAQEGATIAVVEVANDAPVVGTPFAAGSTIVDIVATGVVGPFTVCLDGSAPDRLWHYESGAWVDITDHVIGEATLEPVAGRLCGMTETLSPFTAAPEKLAATAAVTVDDAAPTYGDSITFSATVTGADATPTGTVHFSDGALADDLSNSLGTCTLTAGDCTFTTSALHAGARGIVGTYGGDAVYGFAAADAVAVQVAKATLTVTADDTSATYGGAEPAYTFGYAGFVRSETASVLDAAPTCDSGYAVGTHANPTPLAIACSGGSAADYDFSYVDGELTVGKATLTATPETRSVRVGDAEPTYPLAYTGFVLDETAGVLDTEPTCDSDYTSSMTTGDSPRTITCSDGLDGDYAFTFGSANLTIDRGTLWAVPDATSVTYGGTPDYSFRVYRDAAHTELVADPAALAGWTAPACSSVAYSPVSHVADGPLAIACIGGTSDDYDLDVTAEANLTILPATLVVTVSHGTTTYGEAAPAITPVITGFVNGDDEGDLIALPTCSAPAYQAGDAAADYTITCAGGSAADYTFDRTDTATLTVGPRTLTVGATASGKVYDATTAAAVTLGDDRLAGDLLTITKTAADFADPNVGTGKTVTVTGIAITGGADAANYTLASTTATTTASITPARLTVSPDGTTGVRYGEAEPTWSPLIAGYVGGEGLAQITTVPTCDSAYAAGSPIGTYPVTCTGGVATNYDFTYVAGSLRVGALDLGHDNVVYTGQTFHFVSSNSSTVQVALSASITADFGACTPGGPTVSAAHVHFVDTLSGKILAQNVPISAIDCNNGIATNMVSLSSGPYGSQSYHIHVRLAGSLTGDNEDQTTGATVSVLTTLTTAGLSGVGALPHTAATSTTELGTYGTLHDPTIGEPVSYSFTVTVSPATKKASATVKGQIELLIPGRYGSLVGNYWIKATAMNSVATSSITGVTTAFSKAVVQFDPADDALANIAVDGGASLRVDARDNGTGGVDYLGVTLQSAKTSVLYYSNDWYKLNKAWQTRMSAVGVGAGPAVIVK